MQTSTNRASFRSLRTLYRVHLTFMLAFKTTMNLANQMIHASNAYAAYPATAQGTTILHCYEEERGPPDILRTDNGSEFFGEVFVSWCKANGIVLDYI